ncbi:hypothetical protein S40288_09123 [Stachybotrys chartarum IBT 40288]|nr:hypothetical protein S40288_09123 [Stachybotrys chartarum IBT 40288]
MTQKINSKNLSYDNSLPPFLAALRAQASGASGPDPLLAAQRRSAKKRSGSEEAEDAPLVVDEYGNAVNVELDQDGAVKEQEPSKPTTDEAKDDDRPGGTAKEPPESKTSMGVRKRKVGKVIGDAADETAEKDPQPSTKDKEKPTETRKDNKVKKKAKKIKLSFDEEEP